MTNNVRKSTVNNARLIEIMDSLTKEDLQGFEVLRDIKIFAESIDLDVWGSGSENWINYNNGKRCDGFIPAAHNKGTYDVYNTLSCDYDPEIEDDEGSIQFHGFRIMYEGQFKGIHTVCIYYAQWDENDAWGMEKAKTIASKEIRFKTNKSVISQLNAFANKYKRGDK